MSIPKENKILFVGLGGLGSYVLDTFTRVSGKHYFLVGGRDQTYLRQRTNLSTLAANQLGFYPNISCTYMDLWNIDQTANTISEFQPDIIFCAVTLQPWMAIAKLPKRYYERLYQAQLGPWLPFHLTLVYKLMLAIQKTGLSPKVINAAYSDVVNPVLSKINLAPTTGIGNLANNIPALRQSVALKLSETLEHIAIRFVAHQQLSHRISRQGNAGNIPFHLTVLLRGHDITELLDMQTIFELLPTTFKRLGGPVGNLMTAASATVVFDGMVNDSGQITHAPGPNGLPGGYPVKVTREGVEVILPDNLTMAQAIYINEVGQCLDGIEKIDDKGAIYFAEKEMSILREMLGYECRHMTIDESEQRAKELKAKFDAFVEKHM